MGASVVIIAFLPWLDRSPVKSIRYKGGLFKVILAVFLVSFFILGYLGVLPPTPVRTLVAQICSVIYFGFFLLMPWYSKLDKCKPEPERVTFK
jgi:ubiquinol-cytochrome c reductase cytochrome b subunit